MSHGFNKQNIKENPSSKTNHNKSTFMQRENLLRAKFKIRRVQSSVGKLQKNKKMGDFLEYFTI